MLVAVLMGFHCLSQAILGAIISFLIRLPVFETQPFPLTGRYFNYIKESGDYDELIVLETGQ